MGKILVLLTCLSSLRALEGFGPEGAVQSYDFRDAQAIMTLDAAARMAGGELYIEPLLVDSLTGLRVTLKGAEPTRNWLRIVCDELARLATKREEISLNPGERITIVYDVIDKEGRKFFLVRREVKKP
jgi:hypothetical protein